MDNDYLKHKERQKQMENSAEKTAMKVSAVSIVVNVVLSFFKLLAGVLGNSGAMISDAQFTRLLMFSVP